MLKKEQKVYWCIVDNSTLHLQDEDLPFASAESLNLDVNHAVQIGTYQDSPCYWINASDIEHELEFSSLRDLLTKPEELFFIASRAVHLGHMVASQRFCPQCGGRNHFNHNQTAMQCADCRTLHYPRIFPCIIVAIRKGDQILLAQHARHTSGMQTVIAGFLEVGETLEQCVEREVKEETGLNIKNIRYFGSQPWAFSSSLMMAFLADYDCGDIKVDKTELSSAGWYNKDDLPLIAPHGTIARSLIEQTLNAKGESF